MDDEDITTTIILQSWEGAQTAFTRTDIPEFIKNMTSGEEGLCYVPLDKATLHALSCWFYYKGELEYNWSTVKNLSMAAMYLQIPALIRELSKTVKLQSSEGDLVSLHLCLVTSESWLVYEMTNDNPEEAAKIIYLPDVNTHTLHLICQWLFGNRALVHELVWTDVKNLYEASKYLKMEDLQDTTSKRLEHLLKSAEEIPV